MDRLDHALQFGWATDIWENLTEAVSADQIKHIGVAVAVPVRLLEESDVRVECVFT